MPPAQSSLVDLIELAKEPSSARRRELLRQVTNVFMTAPDTVSEAEMALYDEVMSQLSNDMEIAVRAEISYTIAGARHAPLGLLRRLASDDIEVAEPILTQSKALSENDLMHVVSTQGQDHLRAVSKRENVPENVTGVIVKRGDDTTLHTLLSNDGARFSRATNEEVIQRAQANTMLHEVVVNRKDLPPDLMNDMYFVVEARLRERIMHENAKLDPAVLEQVIAKGRDQVAVAYGSFPADYGKISKDVEALRANGKLTPALLAKYMRDPNCCAPFTAAIGQVIQSTWAPRKLPNRVMKNLAVSKVQRQIISKFISLASYNVLKEHYNNRGNHGLRIIQHR